MTVAQELTVDAANLSVILLGVALLAGQLFRRKLVFDQASAPGRVSVEAYRAPELLIALGMIAIFYLKSTKGLEGGWLTLLMTLFVLAHLGPIRNLPLAEHFGMDRQPLEPPFLLRQILPMCAAVTAITMLSMLVWQWWLKGLLGELPSQPAIEQLHANPRNAGIWFASFFWACIIAPLAEETLFRGFLYPVLKRFIQPLAAAVVVAGIFTVAHPANVGSLVPLFVLGVLLVVCYEWTGTLWAPILVHFGFNAFNLFYTFVHINAFPNAAS